MCVVETKDSTYSRNIWLSSNIETSIILYEDNVAYIAQLNRAYIRGDITKHVLLKCFLFINVGVRTSLRAFCLISWDLKLTIM